jgi:uncharacterized membrane protein
MVEPECSTDAMSHLPPRPRGILATAMLLGLILLSALVLGVAGLLIEETTSMNPTPIILAGGALAGIGVMMLARRLDRRDG